MNWLYSNWMNATPFLFVYSTILIVLYVKNLDYPLFLIWMQTPLYFIHEAEEYILPGGFLDFFNRNALKSKRGDYPLTLKGSFYINIPLVFILLPLTGILCHFYGIQYGLWTAYFSTLNASSHVVMFFLFKKYNPGLIMSMLLNIPFGIYSAFYFNYHGLISLSQNILNLIFGIIAQASMMVYGFGFLVPKIKREGLRKED